MDIQKQKAKALTAATLGLAAMATIGCSNLNESRLPLNNVDVTSKSSSIMIFSKEVPVCKYTIQPGDNVENIFTSQISSKSRPFYTNWSFVRDEFVMDGGIMHGDALQFHFGVYSVLAELNGWEKIWKVMYEDGKLNPGDQLLLPYLNDNKVIHNQACDPTGRIKLTASYNASSKMVVSKGLMRE